MVEKGIETVIHFRVESAEAGVLLVLVGWINLNSAEM
jgi:hypothetical protein